MEATAEVLRPAALAVEAATAVGCRARAAEKRAAVANMAKEDGVLGCLGENEEEGLMGGSCSSKKGGLL